MKTRLDDSVVFRVDSEADSAFLRDEVRRLANKLVSQYNGAPPKANPSVSKKSSDPLPISQYPAAAVKRKLPKRKLTVHDLLRK